MRPFSPFALIDAALQTGRSVRKGAPACSRSYSNKPSAADCDPKQSFTDYGQHRQAVSFDHLVGTGEERGWQRRKSFSNVWSMRPLEANPMQAQAGVRTAPEEFPAAR